MSSTPTGEVGGAMLAVGGEVGDGGLDREIWGSLPSSWGHYASMGRKP